LSGEIGNQRGDWKETVPLISISRKEKKKEKDQILSNQRRGGRGEVGQVPKNGSKKKKGL